MSFSSEIKKELKTRSKPDCLKRSFVLDCFIKNGICSSPHKSYHMEFNPPHGDVAKLCEIFDEFEIDCRISKRRGQQLVYLKGAENISDALRLMGAINALSAFENTRIEKEIGNDINRKVNFETANIKKTVSAAVQHIDDIQFISKQAGLSMLPDHLEEVARLRLKLPDATLKEIGQMISPPIGKSGVNHRLRKISAIAAALKE